MPLMTVEELGSITPLFRHKFGKYLANTVMHILSIDKINGLYDKYENLSGTDFTSAILRETGADYRIGGMENLSSLYGKPFITISNHPYGGLDGIIMIDFFGHIFPGYKVLVNDLLSRIKTLENDFISVIPKGNEMTGPEPKSISGIREAFMHIRNGNPLGIFPSGAVSDFSIKDMCIRDREWQKSMIRVIHRAKVPVLPVRFFDHNTAFFYSLGLINWRVRVLRLPREVINKGGRQIRMGIGKPVTVEEQAKYKSLKEYGNMLRKLVYGMQMPEKFKSRMEL
ncbi:MAG: 1-acyl-sn-glycerol-3-phosphate acyltransferase [Bacteroidales bacterium]|jgi:putative hemolysin|nr:1-acyl-sn-glycerol-3-phosphate acyltransferase [Bacteroidales bacterium]MCI1786206.1 1-acyl-sn-glycerol-3-phosphate acyltransferase [Bacteroidales bacterium]